MGKQKKLSLRVLLSMQVHCAEPQTQYPGDGQQPPPGLSVISGAARQYPRTHCHVILYAIEDPLGFVPLQVHCAEAQIQYPGAGQ